MKTRIIMNLKIVQCCKYKGNNIQLRWQNKFHMKTYDIIKKNAKKNKIKVIIMKSLGNKRHITKKTKMAMKILCQWSN